MVHCGCQVSTRGEPFYIDGEGELIEEPTGGGGGQSVDTHLRSIRFLERGVDDGG